MPSAFSRVAAKEIAVEFETLLTMLIEAKPDDRSEVARYTAITITEVEKAKAIFKTYVEPEAE